MRIVVTGATGYLGHYLIETLLGAGGHTIAAWGRRPAPGRWGLPAVPVELTDAEATDNALNASDPGIIIHAAATSSADAVRRHPDAARAVNVGGTRRLAHWCRVR